MESSLQDAPLRSSLSGMVRKRIFLTHKSWPTRQLCIVCKHVKHTKNGLQVADASVISLAKSARTSFPMVLSEVKLTSSSDVDQRT